MNRHLALLLVIGLLCATAAGCSGKDAMQAAGGGRETGGGAVDGAGVDVDLTALSSTMIYAEVYNIMNNPDDYMGKTIKMKGPYYASFFEKTGLYYHFIIVEDAAACCQQGLEFIWEGDHAYPGDYPDEQTKIEVTGVFGSYEELGITYYYLAVEDIMY